jgi:hypothetical protein
VTLSYLWGRVETLLLLVANKTQLMRPRMLETLRSAIPRTIRDALDLVKLIGEKYLWVDCLCLVQDDPEDMKNGIANMDSVYEGSIVCIVTAAGYDGDAVCLGYILVLGM